MADKNGSGLVENNDEQKVVLLHGFSREEIFAVLRAVKSTVSNPGEVAFATSTPVNLEWQLKDIIKDVSEEHEFFKKKEAEQSN
jgi:hypothetical protein